MTIGPSQHCNEHDPSEPKSGSGKSTLIRNCLFNRYRRDVRGVAGLETGKVDAIEGLNLIYDMEFVDQSPIGRSSRSNPATYIKAWDEVRKLLAETTGAKLHGVTAGMFSFNTDGGRCEVCQGAGVVTIDMQFLADVEVICEKCDGRRFGDQVMKVTFKGKNVNDILQLTVDEASAISGSASPPTRSPAARHSVSSSRPSSPKAPPRATSRACSSSTSRPRAWPRATCRC
jgi:excinuclease ABC subunit A